jgi:serine/threonine protein kinase
MELKPGRILKKRYKIERKIHEGGMGIVYLCKDIVYRGMYVVKHPRYDEGNVDIKVEKLKVEANILKTLSHPHIVKYIDSFEERNVFYMIIEYVDGKDLKTLFQKRPAPESQVRQYGNQLLHALEFLHNCTIIHRDIKPPNVMITRNTVKLIDFGGAKMRFTGLQQKGTILYTPGYGAPEQQTGECYYQSDIFGVGAVLFFLLTGEDPCTVPPLSPCTENPLVNTNLDAVVRKATAMDPNYRFQTATEMKKALSGIVTPVTYAPRLIIGSKEFNITKSSLTIGRGGVNVYPDVTIRDPEKYISRIHAKIVTDSKGNYWIEDYSVNGTFVHTQKGYKKIKRWNLQDNDVIAFCYSPTRGPYLSLKFKTMRLIS